MIWKGNNQSRFPPIPMKSHHGFGKEPKLDSSLGGSARFFDIIFANTLVLRAGNGAGFVCGTPLFSFFSRTKRGLLTLGGLTGFTGTGTGGGTGSALTALIEAFTPFFC